MIVCPNCNHQNPEGAVQCEACYTPLPTTTTCPNCGATVQSDASFCGQCGFNLKATSPPPPIPVVQPAVPDAAPVPPPALVEPDPLPAPVVEPAPAIASAMPAAPAANSPADVVATPPASPPGPTVASTSIDMEPSPAISKGENRTQLQLQTARLLHTQTSTEIELPPNLNVIHIGKPNERIPPDIDVSGFPNSEIVSRIHADIRLEADAYYIEDVGSSNGTYINNLPLPMGNRHRLRPGDRIALGKGDKVTFLFQLS